MKYTCAMSFPYTAKDINALEAVEKWWVFGSHWDPSALLWIIPHNDCYKQLNVPLLCDRRDFKSVCKIFATEVLLLYTFRNIISITLYQQGVIIQH